MVKVRGRERETEKVRVRQIESGRMPEKRERRIQLYR